MLRDRFPLGHYFPVRPERDRCIVLAAIDAAALLEGDVATIARSKRYFPCGTHAAFAIGPKMPVCDLETGFLALGMPTMNENARLRQPLRHFRFVGLSLTRSS